MESIRLLIRRMEKGDEAAFVSGIADRALRIAYGFPPDMEDQMSSKIFERFSGLEGGYSLIEKTSGTVIGFLLEVESEMPENLRTGLPEKKHCRQWRRRSARSTKQASGPDPMDCWLTGPG